MTGSAEGVQYLKEFTALYQRDVSMLLDTVTTKTAKNSNSVVFPFYDRKSATTETGRNYDSMVIGGNSLAIQQKALTLEVEDSKFNSSDVHNMFGQMDGSDLRQALMKAALDVWNIKAETRLIAVLNSVNTTPSNTASTDAFSLFEQAYTLLKYNNAKAELCLAATPAFTTSLRSNAQFSSSDYVSVPKFTNSDYSSKFLVHSDVKIFEISEGLPNSGTNDERCFMYAKDAVGFGVTDFKKFAYGENEENGYFYSRVSGGMGALVLQEDGVIELKFDGSEYNTSTTAT